MQVVGEFLGMDGDKNIHEYFRHNYTHLFPKIGHRTAFVKQVGNLWYWIEKLRERIAKEISSDADNLYISDGFPIPVVQFCRAHFSKIFAGEAAYGYCAAKKMTYYGFKGHLVMNYQGAIVRNTFIAANVDERDVLPENTENLFGHLLADKGLIRPELKQELAERGLFLEYPLRSNMKETRSPAHLNAMKNARRRIETVIGQLTERFNIEKVKARTSLRFYVRFTRKVLSHTIGLFLNKLLGRELWQLEGLVG